MIVGHIRNAARPGRVTGVKRLLPTALTVVACVTFGAPARGQVIVWSNMLPAGHPILEDVLKPWFADIAKATDGRVRVRFVQSPWGPETRQIDIVELRIRHLAFGSIAATPGRFPVARIVELPFLTDRSEVLSVAYWNVHRRFLAKAGEFAKARPLALAAMTPGLLWLPEKPAIRLDDLRDRPLAVFGSTPAAMARRLGALPLMTPPPLAGAFLRSGQVNGALAMDDRVRGAVVARQIKYRVRFPRGLFGKGYFVAIAPAVWDRVAPADRRAILSVSGRRLARALGAAWDKASGGDWLAEAGIETVEASPAFVAAVRARLAIFEDRWRRAATARGVDADGALRFLRTEIARLEKLQPSGSAR